MPTTIVGHIDWPPNGAAVAVRDLAFHGWVSNCRTAQQPATVALTYLTDVDAAGIRHGVQVEPPALRIAWRVRRPDVASYLQGVCPLTGDRWGFRAHVAGGIPPGWNTFTLAFDDPSESGVAEWRESVTVFVVYPSEHATVSPR